ncbi:cytochrome c/c1 heme lyase-domain-containing protein [Naematelia encephala]|uniref:Holocytochrome c-type synthase n=1 Tax=Naematelia encephala TaxID=71784 RepID=A0A1Y2BEE5_9TREE|nr:cytochrome c/c1 heme lyase-domain-containing protein [Naematelia encephala]
MLRRSGKVETRDRQRQRIHQLNRSQEGLISHISSLSWFTLTQSSLNHSRMRWNIGSSSSSSSDTSDTTGLPAGHPPIPSTSSSHRPPASCPMSSSIPTSSSSSPLSNNNKSGPAKCPIDHESKSKGPAKCPIDHESKTASTNGGYNPLNHIPLGISTTEKAPGQQIALPTDRETSTIPRPKSNDDQGAEGGGETWDYPSPQQFYNALVRKGWETPEESIEMVVAIHNFLNERAWEEVMKWEKRLPGGEHAQLARFQGRPGELSPKARMHLWLGKVFPDSFNTIPPFDRHDWIVTRPVDLQTPTTNTSPPTTPAPSSSTSSSSTTSTTSPNSRTETTTTTTTSADGITTKTTTTRYVIDYYSAPPDEEGNPVFHLDVRPALDSFQSIEQRIRVGVEEWMKRDQSE